jgi:serine/threonine-protein kinase
LVGRTLEGRYRIIDRIARGGMSTVYAALDTRLDRHVAVKVMSSALSADPAFTDRFGREARAAARLSHPNVVAVYDQGSDVSSAGHHVFLVMELVRGRTLRALLRERGQLSQAEALSVMEPVLSALAAAHRAGLVHRDVKPENILISDAGAVKVADFGLARAVETELTSTRTGLMMGTVAYCPPEQISRGRADQRSDVYSAGVMLFELLTGKPPFTGDSAMTVAYQHVHERVPAPSTRAKNIAPRVDELVLSTTDKDPAARPLDAGAFLAQLRTARDDLGLPILPVPVPPADDLPTGPTSLPAAPGHSASFGQPAGLTTDVLHGPAPGTATSVVGSPQAARFTDGPHPLAAPAAHPAAAAGQPVAYHPGQPMTPNGAPAPAGTQRRAGAARTRRRRRALVVTVVLLLLGLAAGYGGWWLVSGRFSSIPNVGGLSRSLAVDRLQAAGYRVHGTVDTAFSETVAAGAVVATDPAAGDRAARGKTVTLTISAGAERFTVPVVAHLSAAAAQARLAAIPVQVLTTEGTSDTVPKGVVIGTSPPAGTKVKRSSVVTLTVSTGPPILTIPTIATGTPFAEAQRTLADAGFTVKRVDQFDDRVAKDAVVSISPTGSAVKFSAITVTVSKGPHLVTIPQIAELTPVATARARLEALGLKVAVRTAFGGQSALVVGMDPPAGTVLPVGSTVTLTVV